MEELVNRMKVVLATSFSFALKTQYYHWNIEGIHFSQYHDFFGNLYVYTHHSKVYFACPRTIIIIIILFFDSSTYCRMRALRV